MTLLPNIAIIGKAGSGKSTAADILVNDYGYEKLSFAAPIKVMLDTTSDRDRMQEFGTDVVRAYEPDAWARLFVYQLKNHVPAAARIVVDDCRFPNEAEALRREGFVFVRIEAGVATRIDRLRCNHKLQDEAQLQHVSELALDDFEPDYRIVNNADPESLAYRVKDVLNKERL